jgi:threonine dehydrogenase-like Zn-dependent dehydrogenase
MASDLPTEYRALVLDKVGGDFHGKTLPMPKPVHGSVIIRVLAAEVLSYHREIYGGQRAYDFPLPLVGGCSAIGRVVAVGPDATLLQPGQLVYGDCVIHGRDDHSSSFFSAIHEGGTDGSRKLMRNVWRDGTFAEYASLPLENCIPLDEKRLCQDLGYTFQDLVYISWLLVAFGGLRDIKLAPGETVIVFPATGAFGGAGVQVAIAMGARVIAMGRNEKELARLKSHVLSGTPGAGIETVKLTSDEETDTAALRAFGPIDAVLDFTPPAAAHSKHLRSAIRSLRNGGRVSEMGFIGQDVLNSTVSWEIVSRNITLQGKLMYEREDILLFVKMMERGLFPKGEAFVVPRAFGLDGSVLCGWRLSNSHQLINQLQASQTRGIAMRLFF